MIVSPQALDAATSVFESEPEAVFQARGLAKTYRMGEVEVHALRAVDLDLYRGELVVILGPSSSGKSTLLNILGGLDVPTAGTERFFDHDLTGATERDLTRFRREHVGFVFQFYNLIPSLTALENVALVTELSPDPMDPAEALRLVGLESRMDHFPAQLSGGEQQRVAIARAVAKRPDALLCDEPTGALDFETGKLVLEVLERVNREFYATTAIITHNASVAGMADRVIRLRSGGIVDIRRNTRRARPQTGAGSLAPARTARRRGPGGGLRRGGSGDDTDVLYVAPALPGRILSRLPLCRRLCVPETCAGSVAAPARGPAGRRVGGDAGGSAGDPRRTRTRGAGQRTPGFHTGAAPVHSQRPASPERPMDRARPSGRDSGQRGLCLSESSRAR